MKYDTESEAKYGDHVPEDLDRLGEILLKADNIRKDDVLYRLVVERLKDKSKQIRSIAEMRDKMAQVNLTEHADSEYNRDPR